jgi:hypothetical protein
MICWCGDICAGASYVLASDAAVDMVRGAQKETEHYLVGR